jgi:membrane protease YdiL (CAAX protease family)
LKREYWLVLIIYLAMQLSSIVGIPLLLVIFNGAGINNRLAVPWWLIISFSVGLILVLLVLRREMNTFDRSKSVSPAGTSILWAIFGVFLAFFAQYAAAIVEHLLGIKQSSENTKEILKIIETFPLSFIVTSIFGPILEEIVFRKVIFGALHKRLNFFLAALISSVIFALAHMEPQHIILYSAMGFTFAFLYTITNRITVSIFAHVVMNSVVLLQYFYHDDLERMMRDAGHIQNFIGGYL